MKKRILAIVGLLSCLASAVIQAQGDFAPHHNGTIQGMLQALESSPHEKLFTEMTGWTVAGLKATLSEGRLYVAPCGDACASLRSTRVVSRSRQDDPNIRRYYSGTIEAWRHVRPQELAVFVDGRPVALLSCANPLVSDVCIACCPEVGPPIITQESKSRIIPFSGSVLSKENRTSWTYPPIEPTTIEVPQ
jgi:hypothetical protein